MLMKKISWLLKIILRDTRLRWVLKGMLSIKSWWLIGSSRCLCFKTKSIGWMTEKNTLNWNFSRSKRWEIKKIKSLRKLFSYNLIWLQELDSVIKIHLKKTLSKLTKTPMQKPWRCTSTWSRKALGKMNRSSLTYRFNRRIQWCWRVTNLSHWNQGTLTAWKLGSSGTSTTRPITMLTTRLRKSCRVTNSTSSTWTLQTNWRLPSFTWKIQMMAFSTQLLSNSKPDLLTKTFRSRSSTKNGTWVRSMVSKVCSKKGCLCSTSTSKDKGTGDDY